MSSAAKSRYSAGEVLNLITTDVQRLREFWFDIRDLIYCPFMVFVAFIGLYFELGWNVAFGVGILFAVLPINYGLQGLENFALFFGLRNCEIDGSTGTVCNEN